MKIDAALAPEGNTDIVIHFLIEEETKC